MGLLELDILLLGTIKDFQTTSCRILYTTNQQTLSLQ